MGAMCPWAPRCHRFNAITYRREHLKRPSDRMLQLRERCEDGDRRACVRLGIIIGENRERRAAWRREHPDVFFYERD
jgi:hypothetical protein